MTVRTRARPAPGLYGFLYERLRHRAWERYVKRRPIPDYLKALEAAQWRDAEEIERTQLGYLRALLEHAQANVRYYRELFAKIGFDARDVTRKEDLAAIPLLTKDIIRTRYRDLVATGFEGKNLKKGTSGSTGTPLKFEYSMDSFAWREAIRIRGYRWAGYRLGGPTFHYWAQVHTPKGADGAKVKLDRLVNRDVVIDSMHNDEATMLRAVDLLRRTRPTCMIVYTQSCAMWARFILERGLRDWPDVPVVCGAEAVLPQDRSVLSKAFGDQVFETYGSRETMLMASECPSHDGMHLTEENLLLEVTRDGKPLGPGEPGDVVVTDLHNLGFPFIRYMNGDVATLHAGGRCPCGRGLRRLQHVDGRRADALLDKEGKPIPGIVFHVLLSDSRREVLSQFQAVQKKDGSVTLKYVRGQDWSAEAFQSIVARMNGYLRGQPMRVEEHARIPPMPNGKQRTIVVER